VLDPVWRHVATREKQDSHCASLFDELWLRMAGLHTQFNDLLRPTAPALHQPTFVEDLSNQWVPWT